MSRPTSFHLIIFFWLRLNSVSVTRCATGEGSPFVGYSSLSSSLLSQQHLHICITLWHLSDVVHWQLQLQSSKCLVCLALPEASRSAACWGAINLYTVATSIYFSFQSCMEPAFTQIKCTFRCRVSAGVWVIEEGEQGALPPHEGSKIDVPFQFQQGWP